MKSENKQYAITVITNILKVMHSKEYEKILNYVDESKVYDIGDLFHYVQETLNLNGLDSFDEYGAPCNFHPQYEYAQINFYEFKDNSGFAVDYDLTSNSKLADMCLQMEFLYTDNGLKSVFITVDPQ
ncbi:hypothetical protein FCT18_05850 [Lysinibacillus sphaericus]|uniref:DUF7668 domain-containing protein n=2 Tax=Lysinibacillus TaxID=400634 RepID=A0A2S0K141_LYSSH|nr:MULTISPECIES: hypothetical protein [Lysinibacillus]AVK97112.1 hypothetical protein LS41612_12990 [Lysinibacillus sphaericus]MED4542396.1 hypothetical protein [Lysinibacillus sphaericus]TKI20385.1 hypothetical protein FCT18_05850 [Lysinibacillus sphaericus]TKI47484.1 hypothetical protein FC748_07420 [Lysinibacillus tabacifolii]SUV17023.1 Uncharacterised protein [Lysinibacillus sphaericus]